MGSSAIAVTGTYFPPNSKPKSSNYDDRNQIIVLLKRCRSIHQIQQLHAKIIRTNYQQDPFVLFELLRACSFRHSMSYASKVFEQVENPNVYLYTALIDGFNLCGCYLDGIRAYCRMVVESIQPDAYVIASVLKACGSELALNEGRGVHGQVVKLQLGLNKSVQIKLMELYGKCGEFNDARQLFDTMPDGDVAASTVMITGYFDHGLIEEARSVLELVRVKDTVCWTAMIDGYVRNGQMYKALEIFRKMQRENVRPNEVTIVCVLTACSQLGALELGKWVHSYLDKYKIKLNHFVGSALIGMYSKCGCLEEAIRVFNMMEDRDIITYNSMLGGFSMHGKTIEAIELFQGMIEQGLRPDAISFVGVLNACSHGGLVELGMKIFRSMSEDYGVKPRIEHYGCIVDLLGRVGHLDEAYDFIGRMSIEPDHIIWVSLLSACKIHGNLKLGEEIAKILVDGGAADSGTYVLLANVYSSLGKWEEAARVRSKMKGIGIRKEPGCSSIEVKNQIHEFLLGDIRHPEREEIYKKMEEMNQILKSDEGYSPATELVLHDIDEGEKEWALAIHSERLAICYGLISTEPGTLIRVSKNLRVCNDCHTMIKLIAKVTRRKIVVRDRKRFHHFENGSCSCGDYW